MNTTTSCYIAGIKGTSVIITAVFNGMNTSFYGIAAIKGTGAIIIATYWGIYAGSSGRVTGICKAGITIITVFGNVRAGASAITSREDISSTKVTIITIVNFGRVEKIRAYSSNGNSCSRSSFIGC